MNHFGDCISLLVYYVSLTQVIKEPVSQGFDKDTVLLIMDAWRPSTKKVYTTYLNKWASFCVERQIEIHNPTLPKHVNFYGCYLILALVTLH